MEFLIFLARSPVALIGTILLVGIGWTLEIVLGIVFFPVKAIIHPKEILQQDYRRWPLNTLDTVMSLWSWAWGSVQVETYEERGLRHFLEHLW